jgi:hypothetical protein
MVGKVCYNFGNYNFSKGMERKKFGEESCGAKNRGLLGALIFMYITTRTLINLLFGIPSG